MNGDQANNDEDAALVRLAQGGELSAFDKLVRRYQTLILRFLRRRLNMADAEDVAQETFVKAYQRLRQFRSDKLFKSWLLGIAYHEMIDHYRRARPTVQSAQQEAVDGSDPAQQASDRDDSRWLWTMVRSVVSPEQATALWLYYGEDLSAREIARVMNRSWVSVKVMLHRARSALANHLDAQAVQQQCTVMQGG